MNERLIESICDVLRSEKEINQAIEILEKLIDFTEGMAL